MTAALIVALSNVGMLAVCLQLSRMLQRERRQHARERDLLTNQLLHLAGRTWQEPPAATDRWQPPVDELAGVFPDHLPDDL